MTSPFVGVVLIGIALCGVVLLWQGATGRDLDLFGSSDAARGLFDVDATRDQSAVDRAHPPEAHPRRLMLVGGFLIVLGFGVGAIWTVAAF